MGKGSHVFYYVTDSNPLCLVSWTMPSGRIWRVPCVSETPFLSRLEGGDLSKWCLCNFMSALRCIHSNLHLLSCFQDVESYDPILNPVLNREVRRTGGRVLITLGDQDIDLSPSFTIFLSTRDPSVRAITFPILRVACR